MKQIWFIILFFYSFLYAQEKHDVYFETDKYLFPETEKNRLLLFIQQIKDIKIEKIAIYGFCDDRGTEQYNMTLSQKRADAIKLFFSENNINDSLITNVDGKGEILLKVVKERNINKIRGLNRKVEIIVFPKTEKKEHTLPEKKESTKKKKTLSSDLKIGDKIILDNLLFRTGYSYLIPDSKKTLQKIADTLLIRKDISFTIQGHVCCTKGERDAVDRKTKKRNLSVARAKYIYDYFIKYGINRKRMKYTGMRRKFPLGGDPKYDRRVEIVITHISSKN